MISEYTDEDLFPTVTIDYYPTAVFAGNDELAVGMIQAVKEHGLRVPQDMAVVGFDCH